MGTSEITLQVGDLFSYMPWGNLGFFHDTAGLEFSTDLIRNGTTYDLEAIRRLERQQVRVSVRNTTRSQRQLFERESPPSRSRQLPALGLPTQANVRSEMGCGARP